MSEQQAGQARRRHRSRAEADQLAAEYEASGLPRQEFCDLKSVAMKTLARYVARHRRDRAGQGQKPRWIAVEVAEQGHRSAELSVVLASGRRIEVRRGFDAATLHELVTALDRA